MSKTTTIVSKDVPPHHASAAIRLFTSAGSSTPLPPHCTSNDFYSQIFRNLLRVLHVDRSRVSCSFSVLPVVTNYFNGLHGGAVAAIAERVSTACARTVVAENFELFLGELSMSYLSAAQQNDAVVVHGSVVRSGRNLTVVAVEFKIKETGKLVYTARATFYHMPVSKL